MDAKLFQMLADSLKQAADISKGKIKPVQSFSGISNDSNDAVKAALVAKIKETKVFIKETKNFSLPKNNAIPQKIDVRIVREKTGLSQSDFAIVMNVSIKTIQNWEQHRREPTGPAEALLKIVSREPEVAMAALHG